ncbi:endonuclease Q family protein [Deminuibacter soli]|uniref:DNA helicase UvrD n=1 Tax=Deminuibacter soli TaxID=2291815 RepID=A0A3E1NQD3_9BACT|nr:endonuclease Q family protein [Deminuibacter soli]RFM30135.1 DNA helicase UvrD [Deminuibacter soli]
MFYRADLHIHSHYAQACSKNLNLETLYQWARVKGIHVLGTGDFTHPAWFAELQEKLQPDGSGFFTLKNPPQQHAPEGMKVTDTDVRFCLSTEISSVYQWDGRTRKNHNLVYAPDFETVAEINKRLSRYGNLAADGRPTVSLPSRDVLELVLNTSPRARFIPAHAWTPWFSTLGSRGGYNSIQECFRDLTPHIFAIETGLSSDPAMNWQWSALDAITMVSFSDAHSPQKLGREVTLFNTERSYDAMFAAMQTGKGFGGTYEFFPEEGKYSYDGHRLCKVVLSPQQTNALNGICPHCGKPLTIGVFNRVHTLSDRQAPLQPATASNFSHIVPLPEILSEINGTSPESKKVQQAFISAVSKFGNEFTLLNDTPIPDIERFNATLATAIGNMRKGQVTRTPGYDGIYGHIKLLQNELPRSSQTLQTRLF